MKIRIEANSASELREKLLSVPYGLEVKLPKNIEDTILSDLCEPGLGGIVSRLKGAKKEFRDFNKINSLHVRVYEDYLKAHIDRKNPMFQPLQHLWQDAKDVIGLIILWFNLVSAILMLGIILFL